MAKTNHVPKHKTAMTRARSFGPVASLEQYLQPDWWRRIFNAFYLKTDADVVEDPHITKMELDMFINLLDLKPTPKILDLCCGQGRHSLELARRGFPMSPPWTAPAF